VEPDAQRTRNLTKTEQTLVQWKSGTRRTGRLRHVSLNCISRDRTYRVYGVTTSSLSLLTAFPDPEHLFVTLPRLCGPAGSVLKYHQINQQISFLKCSRASITWTSDTTKVHCINIILSWRNLAWLILMYRKTSFCML